MIKRVHGGLKPTLRVSRRGLLGILAGGVLPGARAARVLRVQNDLDIQNLDPANRHGWYDELVIYAIQSGLCQYKSGDVWGWELDAAQSLVQVDALSTAFVLKPGRIWTDGFGEMTAEDVKFSFERFIDPKLDAVYMTDWEALDHVEVTGRYSGVIRLKRPFAPLCTVSLPGASGSILCKRAVEAAGGTFGTGPMASSGPYRVESWIPRERLVLARNELWNGEAPWFDRIELIPMDYRQAETAYESGDLDMTRISVSAISLVRGEHDPSTELFVRPAMEYNWLGMNMGNPKLADLRVRRAIQRAINVGDVVEAAFGDAVKPAFGMVPPPLPGCRTRVLYGYDPGLAKALLAEAGAHGLSLRLDFAYEVDRMTMAQVIQAQLRDVGITVRLHPMDEASFAAEGQESEGDAWRDVELFIEKFTAAPDPSFVPVWFTCRQVGVWNMERYCDPAFDRLVADAVAEQDSAARAAMYVTLQDMLEKSGAFVCLYHGLNAWACRRPVKGAWSPDGLWPMLRDIAGSNT